MKIKLGILCNIIHKMSPNEHNRTVHDVPVGHAPQSSSQESILSVCNLFFLILHVTTYSFLCVCSIIYKVSSSSHDVPAEYSTINHAHAAKSSKRSPTTVRTYVSIYNSCYFINSYH